MGRRYSCLKGRYYVYAEYCPGPFYWGWWLYAVPLPEPGVKLERDNYIWLDYEWRLDALCTAMRVPSFSHKKRDSFRVARDFLERHPIGAVFDITNNGGVFTLVSEHSPPLWDLHRQRQEQQLLDWREATNTIGRYRWCEGNGDGI